AVEGEGRVVVEVVVVGVGAPAVHLLVLARAAAPRGTQRQLGPVGAGADLERRVGLDHAAVADLGVVVGAPAAERAVGADGAGGLDAEVDGEPGGGADVGGDELAAVAGVAELAAGVLAPAVERAALAQRAAVGLAGRDLDEGVEDAAVAA